MNDIPDVLESLIETHEEDGSPVAVCDPGCRQAYLSGSAWEGYFSGAYLPTMTHCPACGTLVGFLADGTPYHIRHSRVVEALEQAEAERDHLRRALEWACDRLGEEALTCPDAPFDGCHAPDDYDCAGHWREAALAATEDPA